VRPNVWLVRAEPVNEHDENMSMRGKRTTVSFVSPNFSHRSSTV